jgi:hypothetical protein
MDPNVKQRWLAALRGGEFAQAKEVLRKGDAYCCLGVLCELYRQDHEGDAYWRPDGDGYEFVIDTVEDETGDWAELPCTVAEWAGLDWSVAGGSCYVPALGEREPSMKRSSLVGLNDTGEPFAVIADVIEEHL